MQNAVSLYRIANVAHITTPVNNPEFLDRVSMRINEFQALGLAVEIQYQQSDVGMSAFIIGREKPKPRRRKSPSVQGGETL